MALFDEDFYEKDRLKEEEQARKLAEKNKLSEKEIVQKQALCKYIRDALSEFPSAAKRMGTTEQTVYLRYGRTLTNSWKKLHQPIKAWEIGTCYGFVDHASEDFQKSVGFYIDKKGTIYEEGFSKASFGNEIRRVVPVEEAVESIYKAIKACQKLSTSSYYYGRCRLSDNPGEEKEIVQQFFLRALKYKERF